MSNIGTTDAFVFATQDTADLDLHVTGNTFPAAGNRNILLTQAGSSVMQITQASVAALAAANTNSTASSTGTITFNSPVTNPPLPANPLLFAPGGVSSTVPGTSDVPGATARAAAAGLPTPPDTADRRAVTPGRLGNLLPQRWSWTMAC